MSKEKKGECPYCYTKMLFDESILDMWCPNCKAHLKDIKTCSECGSKKDVIKCGSLYGTSMSCRECIRKSWEE